MLGFDKYVFRIEQPGGGVRISSLRFGGIGLRTATNNMQNKYKALRNRLAFLRRVFQSSVRASQKPYFSFGVSMLGLLRRPSENMEVIVA